MFLQVLECCVLAQIAVCVGSFRSSTEREYFCVLFSRKDEVTLTDSYQYPDDQAGDEDAFSREPFLLRFSCLATGL